MLPATAVYWFNPLVVGRVVIGGTGTAAVRVRIVASTQARDLCGGVIGDGAAGTAHLPDDLIASGTGQVDLQLAQAIRNPPKRTNVRPGTGGASIGRSRDSMR